MYVVGDYILVEPFHQPGEGIVKVSDKEKEKMVGAVGEIISVGKEAKVKGVKLGAVVMMSQSSVRIQYVDVAGVTYARCKIEDIAVFYDDVHEYKAVILCEKKIEENKERVARIITPQGAILQPN